MQQIRWTWPGKVQAIGNRTAAVAIDLIRVCRCVLWGRAYPPT